MRTSIFSTYSTGENRVTASILAVLRSLALNRIERLLGALMERSELQLLRFENQPSRGGKGVPDAVITGSCRIFLETKIKRNSVRADQLRRHLDRLDAAGEAVQVLLVLTPDSSVPATVTSIDDARLVWTNFEALDQAIEELLADQAEVISEREAFLLRELQGMLAEEKLVGSQKDVLVVPARNAWPEYLEYQAYACQPNRPFQPVWRLSFYESGQIQPLVPTILKVHESVVFEKGRHRGTLGDLVARLLAGTTRQEGMSYKVLLLSHPKDSKTVRLEGPIMNDLVSESGRTVAFTQSQRYVSLDRLLKAKATSELV